MNRHIKGCEFCRDLKHQRVLNSANCNYESDYSAALVIRTRLKGETKYRAREISTSTYKLNYCPECGADKRKEVEE